MSDTVETTPETNLVSSREATAWCAGLPFVGEDEMNASESVVLEQWQSKARGSARRYLVIALVPIGAFVTSLRLGLPLVALLTLLLVCVSPLVLLRALQSWFAARRFARELQARRVLRFGGQRSKHEIGVVDGYHWKLVAERFMQTDPDALQTLAVLPISRAVLFANGQPGRPDLRVDVVEVAPAPASTFQVPLPGWVVAKTAGPVDVKRRHLTAAERVELAAKVQQLRRLSGGFWVLTLLTGLVFFAWRHEGYPVPPKPPTQLLPAGLWIYSVYEIARNQLRGLRLNRDLALSWVVTLEPKSEGLKGPMADDLVPKEFLLASRFAWTVDGIPAAWRGSKWFSTLLIDRRR